MFVKNGDVLDSLKQKLLEDMSHHTVLRISAPPLTAVNQSFCRAKGKADSMSFLNALISQSIENGWIAAQLELHGMTGKLGIDPH